MSDEDWIEILDQIGASASREELWVHLARARSPWSADAWGLFQHLIDPHCPTTNKESH